MSDYDESSISKTSSYRVKGKEVKIKPGALPWEEESMTFGRDKGAVLLKLQRENADLRRKLKDFNQSINQIILQFKEKKTEKEPKETKPEEILENAKKKLVYYEKEYKRLENRISRLSDPGYETTLKNEVSGGLMKVADLETQIRKHEASQKLRCKELETVMETGEKKEVSRQFFEISKEIAIYSQKVEQLKEKRKNLKKNKKEVEGKLKELQNNSDFNEVEEKQDEKDESFFKDAFEKVRKKDKAVEGKYNSGLKLLELKVKKLAEDLARSREEEAKISKILADRNREYSERQLELSDLQITATASSVKKSQKNKPSYGDDLMFLTE